MRRYAISCEFYRPKRADAISDCIRRMATDWERPLSDVWIVRTPLSAREIRSTLLPNLDFHDRLFVCEVGADAADFNVLWSSGGKVTQIDDVRKTSRMLSSIFSRSGQTSRHLRAATVENLKSA